MQFRMRMGIAVLSLYAVLFVGVRTDAGDTSCDRCGVHESHQVCRLICEKKIIEVPCYRSKCETICVGGPCKLGRKHSESKCRECQEAIPSCPKQYTRKVLMRKMVKKEVTVYRWVVEEMCSACEAKTPQPVVPRSANLPPPPQVEAVVIPPRVEQVHTRSAAVTQSLSLGR